MPYDRDLKVLVTREQEQKVRDRQRELYRNRFLLPWYHQSWANKMDMFLRLEIFFSVPGKPVTDEELEGFWKSLSPQEKCDYAEFAFSGFYLRNDEVVLR